MDTAGTEHGSIPNPLEEVQPKMKTMIDLLQMRNSYFSGKQDFRAKHFVPVSASDDPIGLSVTEMNERTDLIT